MGPWEGRIWPKNRILVKANGALRAYRDLDKVESAGLKARKLRLTNMRQRHVTSTAFHLSRKYSRGFSAKPVVFARIAPLYEVVS